MTPLALAAVLAAPGSRMPAGMTRLSDAYTRAPREYTLLPLWLWNDDLDKEEIRRQIDDFEAHGVYGFTIHPRMGLPRSIGVMSDQFLGFARYAVDYAASKHMVVHLYDEWMYPSGSAGGEVVRRNPAFAARCIVERPLGADGKPEMEAGDRVVTVGDGYAVINALSHGHIRGVYEGTDDGQPDAPPAGDLLNPESTACYISIIHERYYQALKPHFGKTVQAIFTDEPDMLGRGARKGAFPWTTGLETYLSDRMGLDVRPRLREVWHDLRPDSAAFRVALRRAINERLEETFYQPLSDWCVSHGIKLAGHSAGPMDIGVLRHFQIPGQDVVWRYIEPGKPSALEGEQSTMAKCSSSSAMHQRRHRNGNEACGAYGWNLTYGEMRWIHNWLMVRGVNLFWPHAFYYSVRDYRRNERPPDVGPNNEWWPQYKAFADMNRGMAWLLSTCRHSADVAVLCHSDYLPWRAARTLFETQRDFNYLEERYLEEVAARPSVHGVTINNHLYSVLVLDGVEPAPHSAAAHAVAKLERAGRVIRYTTAEALTQALTDLGPAPVTVDPPAPGLRVRPMRKGNTLVWMLFNEGETPIQSTAHFTGPDRPAAFMDPYGGGLTPVASTAAVPLELKPHQAVVLGYPMAR